MGEARQTTESVRTDFDRIASLRTEGWNHNAQYHAFLMSHVPERCVRALEIGCGTGEFSRLLAGRAETVVAVDLSPRMIRAAREHSGLYANVEFVAGDVMTQRLPDEEFDCVATLTTLHHVNFESVLRKVRESLKPGGVFVCLDLYRRSCLSDLLLDCVAYPASLLLRLVKTGRPRPPREVREAYAEHGRTDAYLTLPEVVRICEKVMPGARVSRHLFWRYSVVWKKEAAG